MQEVKQTQIPSFPSSDAITKEQRRDEAMLRLASAMLTQAGLEPHTWGQEQGSKTVDELVEEITSGEIRLQLMRTTAVVRIDVRYRSESGEELQLYEHSQDYFANPMPVGLRAEVGDWEIIYTRDRCTPDNKWAIWEKVKPGESYDDAAARALTQEELPLVGSLSFTNRSEFEYVEPPIDYPGLETYLKGVSFTVYLTPEQFSSIEDGHTELQERKQSHFKWRPVIEERS